MNFTIIEFANASLDFENNLSNSMYFNYNKSTYSLNVINLNTEDIYVFIEKQLIGKVKVNHVIKGVDFDVVFMQENLDDDRDLSLDTLFSKYKLSVING